MGRGSVWRQPRDSGGSGEPASHVQKMTKGEWGNFKQWKLWFLEDTTSFKEDSMEVGAFGLDELSR